MCGIITELTEHPRSVSGARMLNFSSNKLWFLFVYWCIFKGLCDSALKRDHKRVCVWGFGCKCVFMCVICVQGFNSHGRIGHFLLIMWFHSQSDGVTGLAGNHRQCMWEMTCNRLLLHKNSSSPAVSPWDLHHHWREYKIERERNTERERERWLIDWLKEVKMPGGNQRWSRRLQRDDLERDRFTFQIGRP